MLASCRRVVVLEGRNSRQGVDGRSIVWQIILNPFWQCFIFMWMKRNTPWTFLPHLKIGHGMHCYCQGPNILWSSRGGCTPLKDWEPHSGTNCLKCKPKPGSKSKWKTQTQDKLAAWEKTWAISHKHKHMHAATTDSSITNKTSPHHTSTWSLDSLVCSVYEFKKGRQNNKTKNTSVAWTESDEQ